jgi:hypothetical protein
MKEDPKVLAEAAFIAVLMIVVFGAGAIWLITNQTG